jgi:hypothetical protein
VPLALGKLAVQIDDVRIRFGCFPLEVVIPLDFQNGDTQNRRSHEVQGLTYMSHGQYQMVNCTTPYIHTYRKEHPLGQLLVCLEQRIETTKGKASSQLVRKKKDGGVQ